MAEIGPLMERIAFETPPGAWTAAALAALAAAAVVFAWRAARRAGRPWRRRAIVVCRTLAVAVLALAILGPGREESRSVRVRGAVALLVDTSRSMTLPAGPGGLTRQELVRRFLEARKPEVDRLKAAFDLREYGFADDLKPLGDAAALQPSAGRRTDFSSALERLARDTAGRPLRAVLLFTDGADTEGLADLGDRERGSALRPIVSRLDAPIHAYLAAADAAVRDVAVSDVKASRVSFTRKAWPLTARIEATGYPEGTSLPVTLRVGQSLIGTRTVRVEAGKSAYDVAFEWTPLHVGRQVCTVSVPPRADELVADNNAWTFVLSTVRDRIRVLHVAGAPSWDVRFLRRTLKRDPSVDLVSFFILRSVRDPVAPNTEDYEINLIPFPAHELFTEAVTGFDVIVFQNFDYRPYEAVGYMNFGLYLEQIRRVVQERGAGFVMIGGDESFGQGGYRGSPLASLLPVRLEAEGKEIDEASFRASLTEAGLRHPITAIGGSSVETRRLWASMPELTGAHILAPAPGAVTLLAHPARTAGGGPAPVVAVCDAGKGRAMAITADETWRWNFVAAGEGAGNIVYLRFWRNALRWLARDPMGQRLRVESDRSEYEPGESAVLQIEALGEDYGPQPDAPVELSLREMGAGRDALARELRTDMQGRALAPVENLAPGAYVVTARAVSPEGETAETSFNVADRSPELRRVQTGRPVLETLAELTGGTVQGLTDPAVRFPPEIRNPDVRRPVERRFVPLWPTWGWLATIVALLAAEWWVRRTSGLS